MISTTHVTGRVFKRLALVLLCLPFAGCAGLATELGISQGNGYKITKTKRAHWHPTSAIEYKSHAMLVKEYRAELENRLASAAEIASAPARLPRGGRVIVHIKRSTIGAANTQYFQYVVAKNGEEIDRIQGDYNVPNVPTTAGGWWWNLDVVDIDTDFDDELTFYVIDELAGARDQFVITKPAGK